MIGTSRAAHSPFSDLCLGWPRSPRRASRTARRRRGQRLAAAIVALPTIPRFQGDCSMNPASSVFKAYDIRGIVGQTIDERFAEHLGRAFGTEAVAAGERAVAVGRDGRLSGPGLCAALVRGLDVDRARRGGPRRGDHADAVLRGRHARQARLPLGHPGDRQPQPQGLQRLQDGARRPRDLRRRDPGPAPTHGARGLCQGPGAARQHADRRPSTRNASSAIASSRAA